MARTSLSNKVQYTGNGATTVFAYDFPMEVATNCVVIKTASGVETTLTQGVDYSVTINTDVGGDPIAGGNVTCAVAPANGDTITIKRVVPLTQISEWQNGAAVDVDTFESALDKLTDIVVQHDEWLKRIPAFSESSSFLNIVFPELVASKGIKVKADGSGLEVSTDDFDSVVTNATAQATIATTQAGIATAQATLAIAARTIADADASATASDRITVAADKATVAADKATVAADKAVVAADKAIVIADMATVAADRLVVAADKAIVAADKATVAADTATATSAASTAVTQAGIATTKAGEALTSANNAATSETNAAASAVIASNAASGGMYNSVIDVAVDTTLVAATHIGNLIRVDTSGGAKTITLPSIAVAGEGWRVAIAKQTTDANPVNITITGGDTINGVSTYQITQQWGAATIVADSATNTWFAIGTGAGAGTVNVDRFNGDGATVAFTLSNDPGSLNATEVHISGVYQQKNTYAVSGTTLTFSEAPPTGTGNIEVNYGGVLSIGVPADGTVTAAKLTITPNTANGLVQLDGTGKLPAIDGSQLTGIVDVSVTTRIAFLEKNLAIATLRQQIDAGWTVLKMVDGIADEFEDETGVDTATSTNETYDSTGDYYSNPETYTGLSANIATLAMAISSGPNVDGTGPLSGAFDGNTSTLWRSNGTTNSWIGQDFTTAKNIRRAYFNQGFSGNSGHGSSSVDLQSSDDAATWTTRYAGTGLGINETWCTLDSTYTGSHRYWRILAPSVPSNWRVQELQMMEGQYSASANLTLVSQSFTADSVPTEARIVALHQAIDATTLNTDCTVEISRDGGTTWTTGTLVNEGAFDATTNIFSATVDISAQPSGTSMKWRFKTLNNKEQRLHGVWMQWR